jgi:hypothetical protein
MAAGTGPLGCRGGKCWAGEFLPRVVLEPALGYLDYTTNDQGKARREEHDPGDCPFFEVGVLVATASRGYSGSGKRGGAAMNFLIDCPCGGRVSVSERSAGGRATCACGRELRVPALHELRQSIGLPPYPLGPELEIEHMLARGAFPPRGPCARCLAETDAVSHVVFQYGERGGATTQRDVWDRVIAFLLLGWLGVLLFWRRKGETTFDKEYWLPLHLCPDCAPRVKSTRAIRDCLVKEDLYDRLLEKHPYAEVKLV